MSWRVAKATSKGRFFPPVRSDSGGPGSQTTTTVHAAEGCSESGHGLRLP